ncbi:hypothetical protein TSMEX_005695 [Taenia solium]|eukprot:TsM_000803300 transcript=TsM_000803300 gene=TsM_000803300
MSSWLEIVTKEATIVIKLNLIVSSVNTNASSTVDSESNFIINKAILILRDNNSEIAFKARLKGAAVTHHV